MCKVLLIKPRSDKYKLWEDKYAWLGLAYISATLNENRITAKIVEASFGRKKELCGLLAKERPEFVGISVMTVNYKTALKISELCKEFDPKIRIVLGGPHICLDTCKLLPAFIDFAIIGEGELATLALVKSVILGEEPKEVGGLFYRWAGEIKFNRSLLLEDIDKIPMPHPYVDYRKYRTTDYPSRFRRNSAFVLTARGCPNRCNFCSIASAFGHKIRFHSVGRVIREIEYLKQQGIKSIRFIDPIFNLDRDRTLKLCRALGKINIEWACYTHVNKMDLDTMSLFKETGCSLVSYGIESASQDILNGAVKGITPLAAIRATQAAQKAGLKTFGFFVIGLPQETYTTILQTVEYANRLELDYALFLIATPFPGTDLYRAAKEKKYIQSFDWDLYFASIFDNAPIMKTDVLDLKGVKEIIKIVYKRYYLNPKNIMRALSRLNLGHLGMAWHGLPLLFGKRSTLKHN